MNPFIRINLTTPIQNTSTTQNGGQSSAWGSSWGNRGGRSGKSNGAIIGATHTHVNGKDSAGGTTIRSRSSSHNPGASNQGPANVSINNKLAHNTTTSRVSQSTSELAQKFPKSKANHQMKQLQDNLAQALIGNGNNPFINEWEKEWLIVQESINSELDKLLNKPGLNPDKENAKEQTPPKKSYKRKAQSIDTQQTSNKWTKNEGSSKKKEQKKEITTTQKTQQNKNQIQTNELQTQQQIANQQCNNQISNMVLMPLSQNILNQGPAESQQFNQQQKKKNLLSKFSQLNHLKQNQCLSNQMQESQKEWVDPSTHKNLQQTTQPWNDTENANSQINYTLNSNTVQFNQKRSQTQKQTQSPQPPPHIPKISQTYPLSPPPPPPPSLPALPSTKNVTQPKNNSYSQHARVQETSKEITQKFDEQNKQQHNQAKGSKCKQKHSQLIQSDQNAIVNQTNNNQNNTKSLNEQILTDQQQQRLHPQTETSPSNQIQPQEETQKQLSWKISWKGSRKQSVKKNKAQDSNVTVQDQPVSATTNIGQNQISDGEKEKTKSGGKSKSKKKINKDQQLNAQKEDKKDKIQGQNQSKMTASNITQTSQNFVEKQAQNGSQLYNSIDQVDQFQNIANEGIKQDKIQAQVTQDVKFDKPIGHFSIQEPVIKPPNQSNQTNKNIVQQSNVSTLENKSKQEQIDTKLPQSQFIKQSDSKQLKSNHQNTQMDKQPSKQLNCVPQAKLESKVDELNAAFNQFDSLQSSFNNFVQKTTKVAPFANTFLPQSNAMVEKKNIDHKMLTPGVQLPSIKAQASSSANLQSANPRSFQINRGEKKGKGKPMPSSSSQSQMSSNKIIQPNENHVPYNNSNKSKKGSSSVGRHTSQMTNNQSKCLDINQETNQLPITMPNTNLKKLQMNESNYLAQLAQTFQIKAVTPFVDTQNNQQTQQTKKVKNSKSGSKKVKSTNQSSKIEEKQSSTINQNQQHDLNKTNEPLLPDKTQQQQIPKMQPIEQELLKNEVVNPIKGSKKKLKQKICQKQSESKVQKKCNSQKAQKQNRKKIINVVEQQNGHQIKNKSIEQLKNMMKSKQHASVSEQCMQNIIQQNQRQQQFTSEKESVCQIGDEALKAAALDITDIAMSQQQAPKVNMNYHQPLSHQQQEYMIESPQVRTHHHNYFNTPCMNNFMTIQPQIANVNIGKDFYNNFDFQEQKHDLWTILQNNQMAPAYKNQRQHRIPPQFNQMSQISTTRQSQSADRLLQDQFNHFGYLANMAQQSKRNSNEISYRHDMDLVNANMNMNHDIMSDIDLESSPAIATATISAQNRQSRGQNAGKKRKLKNSASNNSSKLTGQHDAFYTFQNQQLAQTQNFNHLNCSQSKIPPMQTIGPPVQFNSNQMSNPFGNLNNQSNMWLQQPDDNGHDEEEKVDSFNPINPLPTPPLHQKRVVTAHSQCLQPPKPPVYSHQIFQSCNIASNNPASAAQLDSHVDGLFSHDRHSQQNEIHGNHSMSHTQYGTQKNKRQKKQALKQLSQQNQQVTYQRTNSTSAQAQPNLNSTKLKSKSVQKQLDKQATTSGLTMIQPPQPPPGPQIPELSYDEEGVATFDLKNKKKVQVKKYHGTVLIDIREFYSDSQGGKGKGGDYTRPGKKGVALTLESWGLLKLGIDAIDN